MTKKRAESTQGADRRKRIADAALDILASEGARGLTHRAVDHLLALPPGSTSYYYRTRNALLLAAAERLVTLDARDLERVSGNPDEVATLIALWTAAATRTRSLARQELLLTAARDPAFEFMKETRERFVHLVQGNRTGAAARSAAIAQVSLVDGLILHGLLYGGISRRDAQRALQHLQAPTADPPPEKRTPPKAAKKKAPRRRTTR